MLRLHLRVSFLTKYSYASFTRQRQIQVLGWGGGGGGGGHGWWVWLGSASGPIRKVYEGRGGGGGGVYNRVSGGPGYSTVVEFMRADINRQRNRAAIL